MPLIPGDQQGVFKIAVEFGASPLGVLPSARQNIVGCLERLLLGQQIGWDDGLGHEIAVPHFGKT